MVFAWRSFEAYPIIVQISGATAVRVPLRPDETHDLDAMAAAVTDRTRLVARVQPEQPHGHGGPSRRARGVPRPDPRPTPWSCSTRPTASSSATPTCPDGLDLYRDRPNVAVLRTFSKAYGLAALRVGFAVAHAAVAAALRKTAVPFGVSTLAQDAAVASLDAEKELVDRVDQLVAERARVTAALAAQGWPALDAQANFVWLRLGARTEEFAAGVRRRRRRGPAVPRRGRPSHGGRAGRVRPPPRRGRALRAGPPLTWPPGGPQAPAGRRRGRPGAAPPRAAGSGAPRA